MQQLIDALEEQNTAKIVADNRKMQKEQADLEKREKEEMQATGAFVELVQAKGLSPLFKSGNPRFLSLCPFILLSVCLSASTVIAYFCQSFNIFPSRVCFGQI